MIKNIYKKTSTNIVLNGESLNAFPLRSGKNRCPYSLFLLDTVLEFRASAVKKNFFNVCTLQRKKQNTL